MIEKTKYNRRKVLLINPKFQLSIIKQFFLLLLIVLITVIAIVLWQYTPLMKEVYAIGLDENHPFMISFEKFQFMMLVILICGGIFSACMFYIAALVISNRVAGPLYHLCNHMKGLREDSLETSSEEFEFQHLHFRNKDYFREVADEINRFLDIVTRKNKE